MTKMSKKITLFLASADISLEVVPHESQDIRLVVESNTCGEEEVSAQISVTDANQLIAELYTCIGVLRAASGAEGDE